MTLVRISAASFVQDGMIAKPTNGRKELLTANHHSAEVGLDRWVSWANSNPSPKEPANADSGS